MTISHLNNLLPEIYPIIAAHLPLYATASTLLALGLANHRVSEIVFPLLYSRLVLKTETDAFFVLQKLADDPAFGRVVRELHIMSDLSVDTRQKHRSSDVMRRLEDVISMGRLPFIHTLGLHLMYGWYYYYNAGGHFQALEQFGKLSKDFSVRLREKCPRLRGLILEGFSGSDEYEPWLEESGILQVSGITNLTFDFSGSTLHLSVINEFLKHISSLAPSLHTLNLALRCWDNVSTSPIFKLDLPFLRSLSLKLFHEVDTAQAMAFFERHPSIEYLNVTDNFLSNPNHRWFASELPKRFLPNLVHLRADWKDVRLLAPILNQLLSLSICRGIHVQITYLLRYILPNGLPNLKSLNIDQSELSNGTNINIEGNLWYESESGTFEQMKKMSGSRTVFDSFVFSMLRAVPNLEELGFDRGICQFSDLLAIRDNLNLFPHLKHLFYQEGTLTLTLPTDEERKLFTAHAADLAEAIPGLVSITNVAHVYLPYLTARIRRKENGEVAGVEIGKGYGMKIGYADEAFPWAQM